MSDRLRFWWRLRSPREQRLLLAMLALAVLTLAWLLVIRPLGDLLGDARARAARAAIAAGDAQARADAIRALEAARPATLRLPVVGVVTQAATEAGFTAARIDRDPGGGVSVTLASARPPAFFGWVEAMEARRGLVVERLGAQPNADSTISAQVTFRDAGRAAAVDARAGAGGR